jgi:acetyl-CoA carboxylase biotin carboxyl carrier protein
MSEIILQLVDAALGGLRGSSVCELDYRSNEYRVRLVREPAGFQANPGRSQVVAEAQPISPTADSSTETVRAGMSGTFYRASGPDQPSLVEMGQEVVVGQQLGLIEAMKMLHAVEAECAGRIAEVRAENGSPVEPGTPLFVIQIGGSDDV